MKYAVCNELFGAMPLSEACGIIRRTGFSGVEFAPYTVFGDFSVQAVKRGIASIAKALLDEGLVFAGFHWLLAKPEGLHFASPDAQTRRRTRDHLAMLLDAAGELGGGMLVLGSPKQRGSLPGVDRETAGRRLRETLADLAPAATARGSEILIEQLSPEQTDVINTMEEAVAAVEAIARLASGGGRGVSSMFDFHNARSEPESWAALIGKYFPYIRHVHINEIDGRAPGTGRSDYVPAFVALAEKGYDRWISMEIFEVPADPEATLREAMRVFLSAEDRALQMISRRKA